MVRAYIAGKVSGMPESALRETFYAKMTELFISGIFPVNPVMEIKSINAERMRRRLPPLTDAVNRKQILCHCMVLLSSCDEIHLLPDWEDSTGAKAEHAFATATGIKIVYPQNDRHGNSK